MPAGQLFKKRKMKKLLIACFLFSCNYPTPVNYRVKIIFCDNRPPIIVTYRNIYPPENRDISTYQVAVPQWNGHLNVCDLQVIE